MQKIHDEKNTNILVKDKLCSLILPQAMKWLYTGTQHCAKPSPYFN